MDIFNYERDVNSERSARRHTRVVVAQALRELGESDSESCEDVLERSQNVRVCDRDVELASDHGTNGITDGDNTSIEFTAEDSSHDIESSEEDVGSSFSTETNDASPLAGNEPPCLFIQRRLFSAGGSQSSDNEAPEVEEEFGIKLRDWAVRYNVSQASLTGLLFLLRNEIPDRQLPVDARTLLKYSQEIAVTSVGHGLFWYGGLIKGLTSCLKEIVTPDHFELNLSTDGLPLFKSSKGEVWPLLAYIQGLQMAPIIVAAWYSEGKPPLNDFLTEFAAELKEVLEDGINVNGRVITFQMRAFVCDYPARCHVKGTKGHTSYHGCDKCVQRGRWEGRMTFPAMTAPLRTDEQFLELEDEAHHVQASPLSCTGVGMVTNFPIDYMHCVCLGVMRKLLFWWQLQKGRRIKKSKRELMGKLTAAYAADWPREFSRKPRDMKFLKRWKATELRQFLLYLGCLVLKSVLSTQQFHLFMRLHVAITILCRADLHSDELVDFADEQLIAFVRGCSTVFGKQFIVYNVHALTHLVADVRRFGSLDSFSAFPYENKLKVIKDMIRGKRLPFQEFVKKLQLREAKEHTCHKPPVKNKDTIKVLGNAPSGIATVGDHQGREYKRVSFKGRVLSTKRGDNVVFMESGEVVKISKFISNVQGVWMKGKRFMRSTDVYSFPIKSSKLGIFKVERPARDSHVWHISSVKCKALLLSQSADQSNVAFPLLN